MKINFLFTSETWWDLMGYRLIIFKGSDDRTLTVIQAKDGFGGFRLQSPSGMVEESKYGRLTWQMT